MQAAKFISSIYKGQIATQAAGCVRSITALLAAAFLITRAQALTLKGEVTRTELLPAQVTSLQPTAGQPDAWPMEPAPPTGSMETWSPVSFSGRWQCETVVVASAVEAVRVGQQTTSMVEFGKAPQGEVALAWEQPGWTPSKTVLASPAGNQASITRINTHLAGGMAWIARSHDHYALVAPDHMVAESEVEQFLNGRYIGSYKTQSVLKRINPPVQVSWR